MRETELIVRAGARARIDRYLSEQAKIGTRSQIQRLLKAGLVLVEGKPVKASHTLRGGERVRVTIPDPEPSRLEAEPLPLAIVYEDDFFLVVNKAAGMVVHPGSGVRRGTLVNALLAYCKGLSGIAGPVRPGIVHRLDKDTTGLVIVAKDDRTHLKLSEALAQRKIGRTYEAIVWGSPDRKQATIETLIGRSRTDRKKMAVLKSSGRLAITTYRVVEDFGLASRLIVNLQTGRTHQIRVHLAHIGHPVLGDPTYGGRRRSFGGRGRSAGDPARDLLGMIARQALHARELSFIHPVTGAEMKLVASLPEDMQNVLERLRSSSPSGRGWREVAQP